MSWPFLFKNQAFLFVSTSPSLEGRPVSVPAGTFFCQLSVTFMETKVLQGPPLPAFLFLSHSVSLGVCCEEPWLRSAVVLKGSPPMSIILILTETSQVSRAGGSWRQSQGFLPQYPSTGHIVEKPALGRYVSSGCWEWDLVPRLLLDPQRWWNVWTVCFLSLTFSPISVFCEFESNSNITFCGPPSGGPFRPFLFCVLDFHSTPILKTLEGITCPVDIGCPTCSSLSWNCLLACATYHAPLLVISCSTVALSWY